MLRKGVNNSRSKLSLSVMKKDKSKNSTYVLVNQVRSFHLRFCCVFFVFLSSLSSFSFDDDDENWKGNHHARRFV